MCLRAVLYQAWCLSQARDRAGSYVLAGISVIDLQESSLNQRSEGAPISE